MVRKNIKKFACLLAGLLLIGLSGFFMALTQWNANYEKRYRTLGILTNHVLKLQYAIDGNKQKLANYDYMAFKTHAFTKRYPSYSFIVDEVYKKSHQYGFKPDLVMGMIKVESAYNPTAVSYKGAYGLMQINLAVWKDELSIDSQRIFEVAYNIDLGLQILKRYYMESRGNMARALHLYNNGYLYNNTAYAGKVDSAMLTFTPSKTTIAWPTLGY